MLLFIIYYMNRMERVPCWTVSGLFPHKHVAVNCSVFRWNIIRAPQFNARNIVGITMEMHLPEFLSGKASAHPRQPACGGRSAEETPQIMY